MRIRYLDSSSKLAFTSHYRDDIVKACKTVPGLMWDPSAKAWVGYRDAMALLSSLLPAHPPLPPAPSLMYDFPIAVRPYQQEAAAFLLNAGPAGAILADAMGLGKTCSALTASLRCGRLAVVCPNYVRGVWVAELSKWAPERVYAGLRSKTSSPLDPLSADTVIVNYDILAAWGDAIAEWLSADAESAIVFDEMHILQGTKSARFQAAKRARAGARYAWGLTGTPLANRPKDLWGIVDILSPNRFGSFFKFATRYCNAYQKTVGTGEDAKTFWDFNGSSNLEELSSRLSHFMLRRTAQDVALQLPAKTRQIVRLDASGVRDVASPLDLRSALQESSESKREAVLALVRGHLEEGNSVVLFAWRRDTADYYADETRRAGLAAQVIHGGVRDRAAILAQAQIETSLLACTIDSCATGIDLTHASVAIFAELDYEPHALLQAEARLHRFGQHKPVLVQYAVAQNSIDERVASVVIDKLNAYDEVLGGQETLGQDLNRLEEDIAKEIMRSIEAGFWGGEE